MSNCFNQSFLTKAFVFLQNYLGVDQTQSVKSFQYV